MPVTALRVLEGASLKRLNTFGVDARAARLVEPAHEDQLGAALAMLAESTPRLVLGGGSNLLLRGDFPGTVLHLRTRGCRVLSERGDEAIVEAAGGEDWDGFVRWTLAQGCYGLENLSLIPGSVGASPIQNIGAYGVEMRERFAGLTALAIDDGAQRDFALDECAFGYRDSIFKHAEAGRWLVTRVRFRLSRRPDLRLDYGELRSELAGLAAPGPDDVARAVRTIRRRKLPDPAVLGNAGSFFKNPVVDATLAGRLASRHPGLPRWPTEAGVKLSAGWMIERCGWKGAREGGAGVHSAHALVLVNHGDATGAQLLALAERIRASVEAEFGVRLEAEPVVV